MRWLRGFGRVLGGCLLLVLLVPSVAAWPSALLDRGPEGSARVSIFPLALAVFDPFVWTCVRNSVVVALLVAGGSLLLGVGLGWIAARGQFWGRGPLWALAIAPLAAGPLLIAPSLAGLIGGDGGWAWLAGRSILGISADLPTSWAALVWTDLACGVPLVALATVKGLRRVEPAWTEAALAAGASRRRAWRDVAWPILRPGIARTSALVFTLALVEPAGPLVFGLDRTLAVQLVRAATRLDQPTRGSSLALLAIAIALVGRSLIDRWGGASYVRVDRPESEPSPIAGLGQASTSGLVLAAWCGVSSGPLGLWLWRVFRAARVSSPDSSSMISGWLIDPEIRAWVVNSAVTAGLAVAIDLLILRTLAPRNLRSTGRAIRLACQMFEAVPPLALAAGALATPWLFLVLADSVVEPTSGWLRRVALELSPGRSPGFLLILVLAAGLLPRLAEGARLTRARVRPSRVDASRIMGESDRRANWASQGGWLGGVPHSSAFLAFALAATSLTPALLLTPFAERRTLPSGVFGILLEAGPVDPRVFGPVVVLLGFNLLAIALASRGR